VLVVLIVSGDTTSGSSNTNSGIIVILILVVIVTVIIIYRQLRCILLSCHHLEGDNGLVHVETKIRLPAAATEALI